MPSSKINLKDFFRAFEKEKYCIIKWSDTLIDYEPYSDVDIFCYSMERLARIIIEIGEPYVKEGWQIKVYDIDTPQGRLDFYKKGHKRLDFRFDLYQAMPQYKKIKIKEGYFNSIIENAQPLVLDTETKIFVPSPIDDIIIRYMEYIEYYDIRADKLKHLHYIEKKITEEQKKEFLDKLHFYTALPPDR